MNNKQIHFVMQAKGGVGKSFVATLLAQYLQDTKNLLCVDGGDCPTLSGFEGIDSYQFGTSQDFDKFIMVLANHSGVALADIGNTHYLKLMYYFLEEATFTTFAAKGKQVILHLPFLGGMGMPGMLDSTHTLLKNIPVNTKVVIWNNAFQGEVTLPDSVLEHELVRGVCKLEKQRSQVESDVTRMLKKRMTFDEVAKCQDETLFDPLKKRRISVFKQEVFSQLDTLRSEGVF